MEEAMRHLGIELGADGEFSSVLEKELMEEEKKKDESRKQSNLISEFWIILDQIGQIDNQKKKMIFEIDFFIFKISKLLRWLFEEWLNANFRMSRFDCPLCRQIFLKMKAITLNTVSNADNDFRTARSEPMPDKPPNQVRKWPKEIF